MKRRFTWCNVHNIAFEYETYGEDCPLCAIFDELERIQLDMREAIRIAEPLEVEYREQPPEGLAWDEDSGPWLNV